MTKSVLRVFEELQNAAKVVIRVENRNVCTQWATTTTESHLLLSGETIAELQPKKPIIDTGF